MIRAKCLRILLAFLAAAALPSCFDDSKTQILTLEAPMNLVGTPSPDGTEITLTWSNVAGETGYRVDIAPVPIAQDSDVTNFAMVGADTTTYTYPTLPNTTRHFRVLSITSSYQSTPSNVVMVTTPDVPLAPTGVDALVGPNGSDKDAVVSWNNLANETGYVVERSMNGEPWTTAATPGANVTSFTDTTTVFGREFCYRVRGTNASGAGAWSVVVATQTRNPSWTRMASSTTDDVSWYPSLVVNNGNLYVASYDATNGHVVLGSAAATWPSFSMSTLIPPFPDNLGYTGVSCALDDFLTLCLVANDVWNDTLYFYDGTWTAIDSSSDSDRAIFRIDPNNLARHIIYQHDAGGVTALRHAWYEAGVWSYEWLDSSYSVPDFFAFEIDVNGGLHVVARHPTGGGEYELSYFTRVAGTWSRESAPVTGRPEYSSVAVSSAGVVHVLYNELTNAGLRLAKRTGGSWSDEVVHQSFRGSWGRFNAIRLDSGEGIHVAYYDNLYGALRYAYQAAGATSWDYHLVDGVGDVGRFASLAIESDKIYIAYGDASNGDVKVATNVVLPPWNLIATPISPTQVGLTWSSSPNATGYNVERSSDGGTNWTFVDSTSATSYTDGGLSGSVEYFYRVYAVNSFGASIPSNTSAAIPMYRVDIPFLSSTNYGNQPALVVAPDGTEHVSHYDSPNTNVLYTTGTPGGPYTTITADAGPSANSQIISTTGSIDRDISGVIYIGAWHAADALSVYDLRLTTVTAGVPSAATVESAGLIGLNPSLKVAPGGTIHAVHLEQAGGTWNFRHSFRSGGVWSGQVIATGPILQTYSSQLAVDGFNRPHAVYVRAVNPNSFLDYGIKLGGTWTFINLPGAVNPTEATIVMDAGNAPHIFYRDTLGRIFHGTNASGTWQFEPVHTSSPFATSAPSAAIHAPSGRIHVAFNTGWLHYARKDPGGSWVVRKLDGSIAVGHYPSVAVDAAGSVHFAYRNESFTKLRISSGTP